MTSFKDLEQSGWTQKASAYDAHFAAIADQAIEPILDSVGDVAGRDVLDICCGTGHLAGAVAARGGRVTGIDFAPTMIEIARLKVAGANFQVGNAEALKFPNQSFDVAMCSFGLWHMSEPDMALAEAARVLKTDGIYAYTTWLPPQQGWDMFDLLTKAVHAHGTMDVDLPQAPPPFRFADESEAQRTLVAHGFRNISFEKRTAIWTGTTGEQLLALIYKAIVRAPMIIEAQTPEARDAIKHAIASAAEAMRVDGVITMRWPYLLASARLP
ncbi:MAG: methyltransferase domain-containing protein [Aestuariivirga sp.]